MSGTSSKKRPKYDFRKFSGLSDNRPYKTIENIKKIEVEPILALIRTDKIPDSVKQPLLKYLVVLLISSLEHYFKNASRLVVDNNNLDTSKLFDGPIAFNVNDLDQLIRDAKLTKGRIVAFTFNFMNLDDTDTAFSKLLERPFLHYVKMLNDINQTRQIFDGPPIPIDYQKLREGYDLRHQLVHELGDVKLTKTKLRDLWDNAMNIMEISWPVFLAVGDKNLMAYYDQEYERGIERYKKRKILASNTERIWKKLLEGDIKLTQKQHLTMKDIGLGDDTEEIDWTLRVMQNKKGLIQIVDNTISLTDKGRKIAKKIK